MDWYNMDWYNWLGLFMLAIIPAGIIGHGFWRMWQDSKVDFLLTASVVAVFVGGLFLLLLGQ